jgi:acetylcholinesterase
MESGAPTCPFGVIERKEAFARTLALAAAVNCPHSPNDLDAVMECLRKTDPINLVYNETGNYGVVEYPFVPIVDGSFLDEAPEVSLKTKNFKQTKILAGTCKDEGSYFLLYHLVDIFKKNEDVYVSREDFVKIVDELNPYLPKIAKNAIVYEYTDWLDPDDPIKNRDAVDKMVGDYHFTCHVNEMGNRFAAAGNDVFMYHFVHRSSYSPWPKWMGVIHADEINFVFGEPMDPKFGYTPAEVSFSRKMMRFWANFAKTG